MRLALPYALMWTLMLSGIANGATPRCAPADKSRIVSVLDRFLSSLASGDDAGVRAALASDMHAFDGGKEFDRTSLLEGVRKAQKAGTEFKWSVTSPDVHVSCQMASIAYRNVGTVTAGGKSESVTWLESAVLAYRDEAWVVTLFHSSRARTE